MFDISQGSTITIEDITLASQCYFIGLVDDTDSKHGYDVKTTIYGSTKIKYSALVSKASVNILFIDLDNKEILRNFFKTQTKINVVDQDNNTLSNLSILGEDLKFVTKYDDEGNEFYTTNFEVR